MKIELYTIYDSKTGVYNKPFYQLNDDVCRRTCSDLLSSETDVAKHPEDFSLFHLGSYNDETAQFDLLATPRIVLKFHELRSALIAEQAKENLDMFGESNQ